MSIKEVALGAAVTVIIGGSAYTISQTDVIDNFADDTGISQQEAENYITSISEDELFSFTEIGEGLVEEGNETISAANNIDCLNYEYEWQTYSLSCEQGRSQLMEIGEDEVAVGMAYLRMEESETDVELNGRITTAISKIDKLNVSYDYPIMYAMLTTADVQDYKNTNSYNKAVLQTVQDSL